jgi:Bacterial protein of unknown function (DUF885)
VTALDDFFDTLYQLRPVDATFIGVHDQDHRLPDWSSAGHEMAVSRWTAIRDALAREGHASLASTAIQRRDWDGIDGALAHAHAELTLAELASPHFSRGNPSLVIGEAAFAIIGLITRDFAPASQRAAWLLPRLQAMPRFLATALGAVSAVPVPGEWRGRAMKEAAATECLLTEGIPLWCADMKLPADRQSALGDAAQRAAGAVAAFREALGALPDAGIEARPAGEALLRLCMTRGHWIDAPLDELLREVRDALPVHQELLRERVREAGATTVAEVQARLSAQHPTKQGFLAAFQRCWEECKALSDARDLVTWPDAPIRYVPIPLWTRTAAPSLYYLYYRSPAPFDTYGTYEYVVAPLEGLDEAATARTLSAWNDSTIKLNHVVHHGALGHHVQNWYAARSPSRIGRIAAADCASRIAMLQGGTMAEGWACYATDLMEEAGFLTGEERVAEQHTRVRMLGRAIVDLEFHTGRCSYEDAVRLYVEEVGMSPEAARAEALKNSMFPGTASMYWFGTQGVHAARAAEAKRRGDAFTLRDFHDAFLAHGSIPVTLNARLLGGE